MADLRSTDDEPNSRLLLNHEWIAAVGGSENVFRQMLNALPEADALCLWNEVPQSFDRLVMESTLATSPLRSRKSLALLRMPDAWRRVDLSGYDTVLSSSHAFGHHLATRAVREGRRGFAYVHTPARYVWAPEVEVRGQSLPARVVSPYLRTIDRRMTDSRVGLAANSRYIRERIAKSWGMDARVIYPAVAVEQLQAVTSWRDELSSVESAFFDGLPSGGFVLGASRLVGYKNLEASIDVGNAIGMPVVIAGLGPHESELRAYATGAKVPVHFVGGVSNALLRALFEAATVYVFMSIEDFGIMPVEAMALGTPVIVNEVGGASESVTACGGGVSADPRSAASLKTAADAALSCDTELMAIRTRAFGELRFQREIVEWITSKSVG